MLRLVVFVVLAFALAYSVRSQWDNVGSAVRTLPWLSCVAAMGLSLAAVVAAFLAWRAMLADLGSPLPTIPAAHIFSVSQVGKYLPGSVWPVLTQMELGRQFQVPRLRMATAFLVTVLSGVVVAFAVGGLLAVTESGWGRAYSLLPLCLLTLHPRILQPVSHSLSRVLKREPVTEPPTLAGVSRTVAWLSVQWLCLGLATAVLADGMGSSADLTLLLGAASLSWAVGLVVVVVPAGAGVREGLFTILLAPSIGSGHALAIALVGRLALTFADAAFAVFGLVVARRAQRHHGRVG